MSSCRLYSDVSLRLGRRCYATVYVYESKEYWEVNECPLPEHCDVSAAEVAALTRGLLRAYQRVPQTVPINAYTDMDGAIELLRRRRFRGSFGGHVRQLSEVVDQRTNVLVLSVPRSNGLYKQCHNRARAAADCGRRATSDPRGVYLAAGPVPDRLRSRGRGGVASHRGRP